jgi:TRAP-type C4-dicarboxylate transport system permease small subunit
METVRNVIDRAAGACGALAALGLLVLMLLTVADVVRRAFTDQSIAGVVEVSPLILLGAVALGMGQGEISGAHVRTTLVTDRLRPRVAAGVRVVGYAFCIVLLAWMAWLSADRAIDAYEMNDTTAGFESIPTWQARSLVPLGFVLFAAALAMRLADDLPRLRGIAGAGIADDGAGAGRPEERR